MSTNHRPELRAYSVIKRGENQDDFWLNIGAAFAHENGTGFNVVLQALPIPDRDGVCKIVLRPPKDNEQAEATEGNVRSLPQNGGQQRRRQSR